MFHDLVYIMFVGLSMLVVSVVLLFSTCWSKQQHGRRVAPQGAYRHVSTGDTLPLLTLRRRRRRFRRPAPRRVQLTFVTFSRLLMKLVMEERKGAAALPRHGLW